MKRITFEDLKNERRVIAEKREVIALEGIIFNAIGRSASEGEDKGLHFVMISYDERLSRKPGLKVKVFIPKEFSDAEFRAFRDDQRRGIYVEGILNLITDEEYLGEIITDYHSR